MDVSCALPSETGEPSSVISSLPALRKSLNVSDMEIVKKSSIMISHFVRLRWRPVSADACSIATTSFSTVFKSPDRVMLLLFLPRETSALSCLPLSLTSSQHVMSSLVKVQMPSSCDCVTAKLLMQHAFCCCQSPKLTYFYVFVEHTYQGNRWSYGSSCGWLWARHKDSQPTVR